MNLSQKQLRIYGVYSGFQMSMSKDSAPKYIKIQVLDALSQMKTAIPKQIQIKILEKIQLMENDLAGDVKKLTNFTPEYRLRVGNYRVLFEIEDKNIVIYRVKPRDKAYQ